MDKQKTHCSPPAAKSRARVCLDTLPDNLPALDKLFRFLDTGQVPNFEIIMSAIAEEVAFYTNYDLDGRPHPGEDFLMSQKKCRFCS